VVSNEEQRGRGRRSRTTQTRELARLALAVQETRNLLLLRLLDPQLREDPVLRTTLRIALHRGLGQVFQLEETELATDELGSGEHLTLLFIEKAEGGLGVLRRLVDEPDALARVAQEALRLCHFAPDTERPDCDGACSECLLTYSSARLARYLDRFAVRSVLEQLAASRVEPRTGERPRAEQFAWLSHRCESSLEREVLEYLFDHGLRLPDDAQRVVEEPRCRADFFYAPNVLVFVDGPRHDDPSQQRLDERTRRNLIARGYRVIVLRYEQSLDEQVRAYPEVFGSGLGSAGS